MSPTDADVAQLFGALESNKQQRVSEARARFADLLAAVKEAWLVGGLVHYYLGTGSVRVTEVLARAPMPHDRHLLDKLSEGLRQPWRTEALALLGHLLRRDPHWLHTVCRCQVFRDLLQLLKTERDIVPLMSGLLVLITLLPMIPTQISPFFQEIFEVFGRLAAWEYRCAEVSYDGHREHLQLALYALFQNLYGMFPCNFVDFLKREYGKKDNVEVFTHTVKPMLESVKVHPLLITASKNAETDSARWKKMEHHDVLVECRRFSSENAHKQRVPEEDRRFRSRCGTDVSSLVASDVSQFQSSKASNSTPNLAESQTLAKAAAAIDPASTSLLARRERIEPGGENWFSLADACGSSTLSAPQTPLPLPVGNYQDVPVSQTGTTHSSQSSASVERHDGGSPPEAAIEATPENTPIKDSRQRFNFPTNSPVVRALGLRVQPTSNPAHQPPPSVSYSQPPSPLKKELSPFNRMSSADGAGEGAEHRADGYYGQNRLNRVLHERSQQGGEHFSNSIPSPQKQNAGSPLKKIVLKDCSNLRNFTPSVPNSPVPLASTAPTSGSTDVPLAKPKPRKEGVLFDVNPTKESINNINFNTLENTNKEDKEVIELSKRGEAMRSASVCRDVNSLFGDSDIKLHPVSRLSEQDNQDDGEEHWAEDEITCVGEDPHCTEKRHGLHMPPSTSMIGLVHRVARNRFHSQCIVEPLNCSVPKSLAESVIEKYKNKSLRRSYSCPEMSQIFKTFNRPERFRPDKIKNDIKPPRLDDNSQPDKSETKTADQNGIDNIKNGDIESREIKKGTNTQETQTVEVWPLTYEHMFMDILQNVCDQSTKVGDVSAPEYNSDPSYSPYYQFDKYIEVLTRNEASKDLLDKKSSRDETSILKQQLKLLHLELLYERHRREVHACRNRRLLGRSRKNRAAEEQNIALTEQICSLQREIDGLHLDISKQKQIMLNMEQKQRESDRYWQNQLSLYDCKIESERQKCADLSALLLDQRNCANESSVDIQRLHATLFDVTQQLNRALRKSELGERQQEFVKRMQRELIICGERDTKYKEVLFSLPSKTDALVNKLTQQYKEQLVNAQTQLQQHMAKSELLQGREAELESIVSSKEMAAQELKKQLRLVKEEYSEKLKSVEDKYQSVKRINQGLEAHCLELLQRVPQSPQTISRDLTSGFSPQSSPLSASLASSEGHGPLLSRVDEMRNLQVIVNTHETIEESTSHSVNNAAPDDDTH